MAKNSSKAKSTKPKKMSASIKPKQANNQVASKPQAKGLGSLSQGDAIALFLALALLVSGLFAALSLVTPLISVVVVAIAGFAVVRLKAPLSPELTPLALWQRLRAHLTPAYTGVCVVLLAPTLYALIRKWGAEFPFEGDYDHHVYAATAGLAFWKQAVFILFGSLVAAPILRSNGFRYWSLAPVLIAVAAGYFIDPPQYYFARYPAGGYMFSSFFMWIAESLSWRAPINASRLGMFLALPVWLFVLRPLLVNKSLTPGFVAFSALVLLQRDAHMYFSSPYLEVWSLVILFVAIERAIFRPKGYLISILLVGLAAVFKENAIFVLPFLWGIWLLKSDNGGNSTDAAILKLTTAVAAGFPFVIYFVYRKFSKIWREVEYASFSEAFASERVADGLHRLTLQYTEFGLLALALVIGFAAYTASKYPQHRKLILALLAAATLQFFFFFMDKLTLNLSMYSRFFFLFFALIASCIWWIDKVFAKRHAYILAAIVAVLMLPSGFSGLRLHAKEVFYLNSLDVPRSPEHYPIRTLIKKAEKQKLLGRGAVIVINNPKQRFLTRSMAFGYRDLLSDYKFRNDPKTFLKPVCNCQQVGANIMMPLFYHSGVLKVPAVEPERLEVEPQCLQSLKANCRQVITHTLPSGELVGALGIL